MKNKYKIDTYFILKSALFFEKSALFFDKSALFRCFLPKIGVRPLITPPPHPKIEIWSGLGTLSFDYPRILPPAPKN